MKFVLFIICFWQINMGLLAYVKWIEKHMFVYDKMFCRDVRVSLGLSAYASDIEDIRKKLNRPNSKF